MPIRFEQIAREYSKPMQDVLNKYFLWREFNSLEEALDQKDSSGRNIRGTFEVSSLTKTFVPDNLPYSFDGEITEINILWNGDSQRKVPILRARYVP